MNHRIVIVKPCCIGDVVFATPLLTALRRGYPDAHIDWIAGTSAAGIVREHPDLAAVMDSGPLANLASRPLSLLHLVRLLRRGHYALAVVPDRSPLLGIATLLAGIPQRVGLDSAGRGFAYTIKAPIDPGVVRHEAEIYLDVARALALSTENCWAHIPVSASALAQAKSILREVGASQQPLIVIHPGGGINPGMVMTQKRWPAENFAALADRVADALDGQIALIGAQSDSNAVTAFKGAIKHSVLDLTNRLSLLETGALASLAALYISNDTGAGHLAAASGAKVLMIFGPSDPHRYAPFVPPDRARVAWRAVSLPERGVSDGAPADFDWQRDGVSVDEAWIEAQQLL